MPYVVSIFSISLIGAVVTVVYQKKNSEKYRGRKLTEEDIKEIREKNEKRRKHALIMRLVKKLSFAIIKLILLGFVAYAFVSCGSMYASR